MKSRQQVRSGAAGHPRIGRSEVWSTAVAADQSVLGRVTESPNVEYMCEWQSIEKSWGALYREQCIVPDGAGHGDALVNRIFSLLLSVGRNKTFGISSDRSCKIVAYLSKQCCWDKWWFIDVSHILITCLLGFGVHPTWPQIAVKYDIYLFITLQDARIRLILD